MRYFLICLFISLLSQDFPELEIITRDNAAQIRELRVLGRGIATVLDWHPDGEVMAVGSANGIWLLDEGFEEVTGIVIRYIDAFYDQGETPLTRYWNASFTRYAEVSNTGIITLPDGIKLKSTDILEAVFWSPDETMIATVERIPDDYTFYVRTWDAITGENINQFYSGMFNFQGLVWSPDSNRIAVLLEHPTGSQIYLRGLRVFTVAKGKNYEFDGNDFETFEEVNIFQTEQQVSAAWNSDNTMLAVVFPDSLKVYDLEDETTPLIELPAQDIVDVEWSKDGKIIASGSTDGTIHLWGIPRPK